jgi:hypothetical protein
MSLGCYHRLLIAAQQSYKFTSLVYKTPIVGALGRGQSRTLIVKKEVMAPCTYVGLALSEAPSGHILFGSLKFVNIDGPAPVDSLIPGQALRFGDLDFVVDHLG